MFFGSIHYASFESDFIHEVSSAPFLTGAWYSFTLLAILGAHEFGHYFTCRHYGIDASLPYFLPAPFITGTVGAAIRIRSMIPTKPILFDIGTAGPIAGFLVALPALLLGLQMSRVVPLPNDFVGLELGEPLLFKFAIWSIWGLIPEGHSLNLHPVAFAAWIGLLVTALNLFPIGQLDGGHISYAVFGNRSTQITLSSVVLVVGLTFVSKSWVVWSALMVGMLIVFGPKHPPTLDAAVPLDQTRCLIAIGTFIIFILCFTPAPIEVMDLIQ
jgi:membrane-associated protease RseP (regulator of RpoE activity)